MRLSKLFAPLALASFAGLSYAQNDLDTAIDEGPSWTAGGHYTAELNLAAKTLTLLPLNGVDQVIGLATFNAPNDLSPGVYMLDATATGFNLISTHPEGVASDAIESRPIIVDSKSAAPALSLSTQAYAVLSDANVGAIYIY